MVTKAAQLPARQRFIIGATALAIAFAPLGSVAQSDHSVWGTIYHSTPTGTVTEAGYRVLLYSPSTTKWTGPSFTNDEGVYTFSDVSPGNYSLQIFVAGKPVFSKNIQAPGHIGAILVSFGPS
jgi:hypothetical protein